MTRQDEVETVEEHLGRVAYEAYLEAIGGPCAGWGAPCEWAKLGSKRRAIWVAVAKATTQRAADLTDPAML